MCHESEAPDERRGKLWTKLRNGVPREDVAANAMVSVSTIKNIEKGKNPSFEVFRRLIEYYNVECETMRHLLGIKGNNGRTVDSVESGRMLASHRRVLSRYEGTSYHVYYIRDDPHNMKLLRIERLDEDELGGFLWASAAQSGRAYECHVTCNSSASFVHFQLSSDLSEASDLVSLLVPHPQGLTRPNKFRVGMGAILSLSSLGGGDDTLWSCFQLAAIVEEELAIQVGEDAVAATCKKYLVLPLDDNTLPGFGHRIGITDIRKRSRDLYRELVPKETIR